MTLYERLCEACKERNTSITAALHAVGRSDGNTGNWKKGKSPSIDVIMDIAAYLNMSLDELVYGKRPASAKTDVLTESELEWLQIIERIPADKQQMCKDFLRTHMVAPEKYLDKKRA